MKANRFNPVLKFDWHPSSVAGKRHFLFYLCLTLAQLVCAQDQVETLTDEMFETHQRIFLAPMDGWVFRQGHDRSWADPELDVSHWQKMNLTELSPELEDETGKLEGWFRLKFTINQSLEELPLAISKSLWAATDVRAAEIIFWNRKKTGTKFTIELPI